MMNQRVIQITINTNGNAVVGLNSINRAAGSANQSVSNLGRSSQTTSQQLSTMSSRLVSAGDKMKSFGVKASIGLTAPLVLVGKAMFSAASDAQELTSMFDATFGKMSKGMTEWAVTTGDAMGRSTQELQQASAVFQGFFKDSFDEATAAEMSKTFTVLSQDIASFKNLSNEDANRKIFAALTGETEGLKALGVVINDNVMKAKAMEMGLGNNTSKLTEQQKVLIRAELLQQKFADASGDVINTLDSSANQIKKSEAAWQEMSVALGTKLLPALTPIITGLGDLMTWFSKLNPNVQTGIVAFAGLLAVVGPLSLVIGGITSVLGLFSAAITGAGIASGGAAAGTGLLSLSLLPIAAIIGGIVLVVGGLYLAWKNWDKITEVVTRVWGAVKTYVMDKIGGAINFAKNLITAYINLWTTVGSVAINAVQKLYIGVKTWLQDKLGGVFNWLKSKLEAVGGYFFKLYDAVVGHSYIPDMVDEVGQHIKRLDNNMVKPVEQQTDKVAASFAKLKGKTADFFSQILPERAEINALQNDLTKLEKLKSKISPDLYAKSKKRLNTNLASANDTLSPKSEAVKALEESIKDINQFNIQLTKERQLLQTKTVAQVQDELSVFSQLADKKRSLLADGQNLNDTDIQQQLQKYEGILRQNQLLEKQIGLKKAANDNFAQFSPSLAKNLEVTKLSSVRDDFLDKFKADPDSFGMTPEQRKKVYDEVTGNIGDAIESVSTFTETTFLSVFDRLADQFGGKLGNVINSITNILDSVLKIDPTSGLGKSLDKIFGKTSNFGKTLGKLGEGAEVGAQIDGLAKAVGFKKFSKTGAQIGGAIGQFAGPIGSVVGSVLGGIFGSLFKKTPSGAVQISGQGDQRVYGNNDELRQGLARTGTAVQDSIQGIADALGGEIGKYEVSIGKREDHFRVAGSLTDRVSQKHPSIPLLYNGTDEGEAQRIALLNALQDGAITGISRFSDSVLKAATNIKAAVALVQDYETAMGDLAAIDDPFKAAITNVTEGLESLIKRMKTSGATADELGEIERYRSLKYEQILKDQLSTLSDFQKTLNGEGSGVTALNRLFGNLADFGGFKNDIAAGNTIDQGAFTSLGQEILSLAGQIYGTSTSQFQAIRSDLISTTQAAVDNVQIAYDDTTVTAINSQTDAITAGQDIANEYLRQMAEYMAGNGSGAVAGAGGSTGAGVYYGGGGSGRTVNGRSNIDLV